MKEKVIGILLTLTLMLNLLSGLSITACAEAATKAITEVEWLDMYCYYDENSEVKAGVLLLDGDTVLQEGQDYEVAIGSENEGSRSVTVTGMNNYSGTTSKSYGDDIYEMHITDDWKYLYYDDGESDGGYLLSYIGNETEIIVPDGFGEYDEYFSFDGFRPGVFTGLENVTSINLDALEIIDDMIINCPKLSQLTIRMNSGYAVDIIRGDVAEGFNITAPSDLYLYDSNWENQISIKAYCDSKGYKYTDKYVVAKVGDWTYKINGTWADVISYTGTDETVVIPSFFEYDDGAEDTQIVNVNIDEIQANAFSDLETLETLVIGDFRYDIPICSNCSSLNEIKIACDVVNLNGGLTDGTKEENANITIYGYPDAVWYGYDEETATYNEGTIAEYCELYGYQYAEMDNSVESPEDSEWGTFSVALNPVGKFVVGKEAIFSVSVTNTGEQILSPNVYNWFYKTTSADEVGEEFGTIYGDCVNELETGSKFLTIAPGETVTFQLKGVVPITWNKTSQIYVVLVADDVENEIEYCGQGIYTNPAPDTVTQAHAHTFSKEWTLDVAPTCAANGSQSHHCMDATCGEKADVTVVPATGVHTYGAWVETLKATCDKAGTQERTCTVCGNKETGSIPATGYVKGGEFNKGKNTFTIKKVKGKKGTVVYEGSTKKAKKVKVPKTVKVDGVTYTVTEIAEGAFKGDTKMTSVVIPEGITKIGKDAFNGCKKLKTITIKSTKLKTVGKDAIKGIHKKAVINCPEKKLDAYKKLFKNKTGYKKTMTIK